jgi:hypothetical protein
MSGDKNRVAVVGGGIAGMTAALRLAERGFQVTVFEASDHLGGNLSAGQAGDKGPYHDVYPHMFCSWYNNFWTIFERDLGLNRDDAFEPRIGVKLLREGSPEYLELTNASTVERAIENLRSGVVPTADMYVWGYSMLDLISQSFHPTELLSRYSVNGFMHSRPYATPLSAELHDLFLMEVWSVHGDQTSASSYKDFIRYSMNFPEPTPFAWLLKGNCQENLIAPFERKLVEGANPCVIRKDTAIASVGLEGDGRVRLGFSDGKIDTFDHVVLATTAKALAQIVEAPVGEDVKRIVDVAPEFAELRRLRAEPLPVVDIYFKKKLPDIPKEHVGLGDSKASLTFLDISNLRPNDPYVEGVTVLTLAASDFYAIPEEDPHRQAHSMIRTLHKYLPVFNPGSCWGDEASDINWDLTHYQTNREHKLFINEAGSEEWRPSASHNALPNVYFAGDYCLTEVDMASIEAAVMSGLYAASALCNAESRKGARLNPVDVAIPKAHSQPAVLAAKFAAAPYAYAAKWWSTANETLPLLGNKEAAPKVSENITSMYALPHAFAADWMQTASAFWQSVLTKR